MTEPYYEVIDAEYVNDAHPPAPWRVFARPSTTGEWAMDEEDAACMWAEARWSDYDHPNEMEALVTHSDGRKWKVTVTVEAVPSFHGRACALHPVCSCGHSSDHHDDYGKAQCEADGCICETFSERGEHRREEEP